MTTTPLPPLPEPTEAWLPTHFMGYYTADQMQAYATQARADLEAEMREAALNDLAYVNGVKMGWSLCAMDNEAGFQRITEGRVPEAMRAIKELRAKAAPQQAEDISAFLRSEREGWEDREPKPQADRSGCAAGSDEECTNRDCATRCPAMKQPQAEAVHYTRADLDRAYSAGLVEGERLAIQQAESVPSDVVRDAAPIPDHELVTMYDERPTSDLEMIEFAREVERRHGIGVQPQHITDGSPCWCNPDVAYTDPETGASVIVHRRPQ